MAQSTRQLTPLRRLSPLWPWSVLDDRDWFSTLSEAFEDDLDVYETDNEVVIEAAVPGIPADQVKVTFEDGVMRITADYKESEDNKQKKKNVYRQRRELHFDYATTLPRSVDADKITAAVDNGVVTIKAPVTEDSKPRRISVTTEKNS